MTLFIGDLEKNRNFGYWNTNLPYEYNNMSYRHSVKDGEFVKGPISIVVPSGKDSHGFILKGIADDKGLNGPGQLIRSDGFYLEGMFDSRPIPINWVGSNGDSIESTTYRIIGSYAYGNVKAYWPIW